MRSYYRQMPSGQYQSEMGSLVIGINKYNSDTEIHDHILSDALNAYPYNNEAVSIDPGTPDINEDDSLFPALGYTGRVLASECLLYLGAPHLVVFVYDSGVYKVVSINLTTQTQLHSLTVSGWASPVANIAIDTTIFRTEAFNYVVFASDTYQSFTLYNFTGTLINQAVDFKPKRLTSYANRIFAIDTGNILWWCGAGMYDNWHSTTVDESYIQEDAGYWVLENESVLSDIIMLNNAVYIFAPDNIYIFRGYDYETFVLQPILSNIGLQEDNTYNRIVLSKSIAYFIYKDNIYEFNGSARPSIINRPVLINGQNVNGISGGIPRYIDESNSKLDGNLYADNENLYLWIDRDFYMYDLNARSWWYFSGFAKGNEFTGDNDISQSYFWNLGDRKTDVVISDLDSNTWSAYNRLSTYVDNAYVVTKAYNSIPSEKQALTNMTLETRGDAGSVADITISIYLYASDEWVDIKTLNGHMFTGNVEMIDIYIPPKYVVRTSHYKIRVSVSGSALRVYNMERRFRIQRRSR